MTLATSSLYHFSRQTLLGNQKLRGKALASISPFSVIFHRNLSDDMLLMSLSLQLKSWFCFALYCCVGPEGGHLTHENSPLPPSGLQTVAYFI